MEELIYQGSPDEQARILFSLKNAAQSIAERAGLAGSGAVVLTGGFGRGEGSLLREPGGAVRPFNDFDILLIGTKPAARRGLLNEVRQGLPASLGVDFVDVGYIRSSDFAKAEPTVFLYDLKRGSRVLWGSPCVLDAVPAFGPTAIPLTEGTRLFLNRGLSLLSLLLMIHAGEPAGAVRRSAANAWSKSVLAAGDSFLIERRLYHWSYATRVKRMEEAGGLPGEEGFVRKYTDAATFKLTADFDKLPSQDPQELFADARALHEKCFRLFEQKRTFNSLDDWTEYPAVVVRAGLFPLKRRAKEAMSLLTRNALKLGELGRFARLPLVGEERRLALLPLVLYSTTGGTSQPLDARYLEAACRLELGRASRGPKDWARLAARLAEGAHP
jgi:hypothetical protein